VTDRHECDSDAQPPRNEHSRPEDIVWRLPDGVRLSWRAFDDGVVVFNAFSGQTHLLDSFSAAVLEEIERAPASRETLAERLAGRFDLDDAMALAERLDAALAEFDRQGLADPSAPDAAVS